MSKYRIKIAPTWFSDDYIVLKYSTNGIFWRRIKAYHYESLDNWCYLTTKIIQISDAEFYINKFKTIQDVINFEKEESKKVENHNNEVLKRNNIHKKYRDEVYKRFS